MQAHALAGAEPHRLFALDADHLVAPPGDGPGAADRRRLVHLAPGHDGVGEPDALGVADRGRRAHVERALLDALDFLRHLRHGGVELFPDLLVAHQLPVLVAQHLAVRPALVELRPAGGFIELEHHARLQLERIAPGVERDCPERFLNALRAGIEAVLVLALDPHAEVLLEEVNALARGHVQRQAVDVGEHHAALLDERRDPFADRRRAPLAADHVEDLVIAEIRLAQFDLLLGQQVPGVLQVLEGLGGPAEILLRVLEVAVEVAGHVRHQHRDLRLDRRGLVQVAGVVHLEEVLPVGDLLALLLVAAPVDRGVEPVVGAVHGVPHHAGHGPVHVVRAVEEQGALVAEVEPDPAHDDVPVARGQPVGDGVVQVHHRLLAPHVLHVHHRAQAVKPIEAVAVALVRAGPDDEVLREGIAGDAAGQPGLLDILRRILVHAAEELEREVAVEVHQQLVAAGLVEDDRVHLRHLRERPSLVPPRRLGPVQRDVQGLDLVPARQVLAGEGVVRAAVLVRVLVRRLVLEPDLGQVLAEFGLHRVAVVHLRAGAQAHLVPGAGEHMIHHREQVLAVHGAHARERAHARVIVVGGEETAAGLALAGALLAVELQGRRTHLAEQGLVDGAEQALFLQELAAEEAEVVALVDAVVAHAVPVFEAGLFILLVDGTGILAVVIAAPQPHVAVVAERLEVLLGRRVVLVPVQPLREERPRILSERGAVRGHRRHRQVLPVLVEFRAPGFDLLRGQCARRECGRDDDRGQLALHVCFLSLNCSGDPERVTRAVDD